MDSIAANANNELQQKIERIQNEFKNDPLFQTIIGTSNEEKLFDPTYLMQIEEKRWYSTTDVAEWFNITDGQLRYYIKPFHEYIFSDDSPSSRSAYRLNFESIVKLRMILLLKDEYRITGIKKLLGQTGYVVRKSKSIQTEQTELANKDELTKQVALLSAMMEQVVKSGLFELKEQDGEMKITISDEFVSKRLQRYLSANDESKVIEEIREVAKRIQEENSSLREELNRIRNQQKEDIVKRIKERQIEARIKSELRSEALKLWAETKSKSFGLWANLFKREQIDQEKELFIQKYLQDHLDERLEAELRSYYSPKQDDHSEKE